MISVFRLIKENEQLRRKNNTLENDNLILKEKVIKIVLNKFEENETTKKLRESNKRLRIKNKELKALLNEKATKR